MSTGENWDYIMQELTTTTNCISFYANFTDPATNTTFNYGEPLGLVWRVCMPLIRVSANNPATNITFSYGEQHKR
jgi:hypothetical protein